MLVGDIHGLPETQRTALVLREMDALSYEQIAEAMETTVPSVKSLLVRARVSLAEAAQARMLTCEDVRVELGEVAEGLLRRPSPLVRRHLRTCERCCDLQVAAERDQQGAGRGAPDRGIRAPAQAGHPAHRPFRRRGRRLERVGRGRGRPGRGRGLHRRRRGHGASSDRPAAASCRPAWARSPPRRPPASPPPRWSPPARSRSTSPPTSVPTIMPLRPSPHPSPPTPRSPRRRRCRASARRRCRSYTRSCTATWWSSKAHKPAPPSTSATTAHKTVTPAKQATASRRQGEGEDEDEGHAPGAATRSHPDPDRRHRPGAVDDPHRGGGRHGGVHRYELQRPRHTLHGVVHADLDPCSDPRAPELGYVDRPSTDRADDDHESSRALTRAPRRPRRRPRRALLPHRPGDSTCASDSSGSSTASQPAPSGGVAP